MAAVPAPLAEGNLARLDHAYYDAEVALTETSHAGKIRAALLSAANPVVGECPETTLRALLRNTSFLMGRWSGSQPSRDAVNRACVRRSLNPEGVVPGDYNGLKLHVRAMRSSIVRMHQGER